eukprot:Plantae.Rhodophyta-Purpureofilum_apyrenoidigerum.ctg14680.p1 GENE.Plantae.Rhodophyta-Purpureofilum_apyrenoidigerum.ctg14680~~Plantae.Rhodophyta-Purpureofilum_apyrenoidigerum.ctg14680.p1  ORF type:complete len:763 (+),score=117.86 Plantae.Rhodophyta-Purpureofilum_apyrenoidigerum.ctg14680:455-2743(+)
MADWDAGSVYYSYQNLENPSAGQHAGISGAQDGSLQGSNARKRFCKFLLDFSIRNRYLYREKMLLGVNAGEPNISVSLDHLQEYDNILAESVRKNPGYYLPVLEMAAGEISVRLLNDTDADDLANARGENGDGAIDIRKRAAVQVTLTSSEMPKPIRDLQASSISNLIRVTGIVISVSRVHCKALTVTLECKQCRERKIVHTRSGLGGIQIPRTCQRTRTEADERPCPIDPYIVLPDEGKFLDQQTIKLQELPEQVPTGEVPRSILATVDRALAGQLSPGMRVSLFGIYGIVESYGSRDRAQSGFSYSGVGAIRTPYVQTVGVLQENDVSSGGRTDLTAFDLEEEEQMQRLVRTPNLYEKIAASIAPEIYGFEDVKKAIAAMLFGGSRKVLPDGVRIRGDINVLLLGDPSTAKSQLLKFVEKAAPISVYTSGKGSSAAGLTAAVLRDPGPLGEFRLEGGAMVLADGGVVCIDEFDKMRLQDSVAIHEAMEQQTISVAKAGITSVLNSRTSVLAAANPVFGRFDDTRPADENIDFQTTILSRFDLIFMIRDVRNDAMDYAKAQHVLRLHQRGNSVMNLRNGADDSDHISLATLRSFIAYARSRCSPRLTPEAASILRDAYVRMRQRVKQTDEDSVVPITVRQLESLVRLTEGLAKMTLSSVTSEHHVHEAIRLFQVATMESVNTGAVVLDGRLSDTLRLEVERAREILQRRLPVGSSTSKRKVIFELKNQAISDQAARLAIEYLHKQGDIDLRRQRKLVYRVR